MKKRYLMLDISESSIENPVSLFSLEL